MAKVISDEQMRLTMIINGDDAQKELYNLEKSTRSLNEENKGLLLQKKLLEKQNKKDSAEYKLLTTTIRDNNREVAANRARMSELQNQMGLTSLTTAQLNAKATQLRGTLRNLVPGSADYIRYQAELDQVNNRMRELSGRAITARTSLSSMADTFNRFQGMAIAAIAVLTGFVVSVQKIIDINGKLSDAQSDVMKTTQMTKKEVDELTRSFGLLETRTSRIDLLKIAEEGGRVGILKEDIGDFVNVMNKASVALGDSFTGGAEEVAAKLGKIKFLFQETKDLGIDKAYNSIGSAINDLGADGVASERNIAEFTTRIGSLTDVLKPTIQETLALGAAFEESGIEAEISSRAYGIFMNRAATESAKFAEVMGISKKAVEDMINTNPLDFMLKFAEGMKGMNATDVAKTLDYLKINADGANKVIGAMGNNTARFRQQIDLSNKSFAEGTSLINEYDIKNNNLAATLEKVSKRFAGYFTSETFVNFLLAATDVFAKFIGATEDAEGTVTAWRKTLVFAAKAIAIVSAALLTNLAWQKLVVLWTTRGTSSNLLYIIAAKARAFAEGAGIVATQAYAIATMLLTGNVRGAAQAFRVLTATMMTTPWGFILGAVAAIGAAYVIFSEEAKTAATAQSMLQQTMRDTADIVQKETASMNVLIALAKDETASKEARMAAIKKLNELAPEYLGNLTLENIKTEEGTKILENYVKVLEKKAMLQVLEKRQAAIIEEMQEKKNQSLEEEIQWYDKAWATLTNFNDATKIGADLANTAVNRRTEALAELQNQLNLTNAEMAAFLKKNPSVIVDIDSNIAKSDYKVPTDGSGSSKKSKKYDDSYLTEEQRLRDALYKIRQKSEKERIDLMEEGWEKQIALERFNHEAILQEIIFQEEDLKALKLKTQAELILAEKAGDRKKVDSLKNQQALILGQEIELNEQRENEAFFHTRRIGILEEKAGKELIDKEKETYERRKTIRETEFLNELMAMDISEAEKEKKRKDFAYLEIEYDKEYLQQKIDQLNQILAGEVVNGIDFNLLSPEAKDKIQQDVELVQNALAKLMAAKDNPESGKELDLGLGGKTDMLGFSQEQWQTFYKNIEQGTIGIQTMAMAAMAVNNVFGELDKLFTAQENGRLKKTERNAEREKKALKRSLDAGVINQVQYKKAIEKVDLDLDKKKADIEYKQAKRQRAMAIAQAITGTALAVLNALQTQPFLPMGPIMAGVAAVMGGIQLATILSAPMPAKGYEQGLYPEYVKREQDGKVFKSRFGGKTRSGLVKDTSHFIVAENGPEMVIDNNAWRQLDPNVKQALLDDLRGIKGFEKGKYSPEVTSSSTAATAPANNDEMMMQMMATMNLTNELLKFLIDNGLLAKIYTSDEKAMADLKKGIDKAESRRQSNKL